MHSNECRVLKAYQLNIILFKTHFIFTARWCKPLSSLILNCVVFFVFILFPPLLPNSHISAEKPESFNPVAFSSPHLKLRPQ